MAAVGYVPAFIASKTKPQGRQSLGVFFIDGIHEHANTCRDNAVSQTFEGMVGVARADQWSAIIMLLKTTETLPSNKGYSTHD